MIKPSSMNSLKIIIGGVAVAAMIASTAAVATPGSNVGVSGVVNGHFGTIHEDTAGGKTDKWGLILKTLDDTDIGADQITLQGGGYTGWHPVCGALRQGVRGNGNR